MSADPGDRRSSRWLTMRLLMIICMIFDFKLVRLRKVFCSRKIRKWPIGALTRAPYAAILGTLDVK